MPRRKSQYGDTHYGRYFDMGIVYHGHTVPRGDTNNDVRVFRSASSSIEHLSTSTAR